MAQKSIETIRDEGAENYAPDYQATDDDSMLLENVWQSKARNSFKAGFSACLEALSEVGVEGAYSFWAWEPHLRENLRDSAANSYPIACHKQKVNSGYTQYVEFAPVAARIKALESQLSRDTEVKGLRERVEELEKALSDIENIRIAGQEKYNHIGDKFRAIARTALTPSTKGDL